jgi:hypothetical protein
LYGIHVRFINGFTNRFIMISQSLVSPCHYG